MYLKVYNIRSDDDANELKMTLKADFARYDEFNYE